MEGPAEKCFVLVRVRAILTLLLFTGHCNEVCCGCPLSNRWRRPPPRTQRDHGPKRGTAMRSETEVNPGNFVALQQKKRKWGTPAHTTMQRCHSPVHCTPTDAGRSRYICGGFVCTMLCRFGFSTPRVKLVFFFATVSDPLKPQIVFSPQTSLFVR